MAELMKINTEVTIAGVTFKNPVMTASGTFGSGMEYGEFVDLNKLGAVVTKGVANVPWPGNPTPRVTETYGGMLNAIGLQNPGITHIHKTTGNNIRTCQHLPGFSIQRKNNDNDSFLRQDVTITKHNVSNITNT